MEGRRILTVLAEHDEQDGAASESHIGESAMDNR